MKHILTVTVVVVLYTIIAASSGAEDATLDNYPQVTLSNGLITMTVFLPDEQNGFYRSTRFEWSGMVRHLTWNKHTYFGTREHMGTHNPVHFSFGISLAEEFTTPQGFNEAKPGETFIKIGCGNLEKPADGKQYIWRAPYKIVDSGTWTVKQGKTWVEFTHELKDDNGYGYMYIKRMVLKDGKPALIISHELKNTGSKTFIADQYCHNFFTIDSTPMKKSYELEFAFAPTKPDDLSPNVTLTGKKLAFTGDEGSVYVRFSGFSDSPADNFCIMRNTKTGGCVKIGGDFPLSSFNLWSDGRTLCPELFKGLFIDPGKTDKWTRTYLFFEE